MRPVEIDQIRADLARRGVPLELPSLANRRMHHMAKHRTVAKLRQVVAVGLLQLGTWRPELPALVVITRVAPRRLDGHDNLQAACKPVVDELAEWLGLATDDDPRVRWAHRQTRGEPKEQAVRIAFAHGSRVGAVLRQLEAIVEETAAGSAPERHEDRPREQRPIKAKVLPGVGVSHDELPFGCDDPDCTNGCGRCVMEGLDAAEAGRLP